MASTLAVSPSVKMSVEWDALHVPVLFTPASLVVPVREGGTIAAVHHMLCNGAEVGARGGEQ